MLTQALCWSLRDAPMFRHWFHPYNLKCTFCPRVTLKDPITASIDIEPLLQVAVGHKDLCFEQVKDNTKGLGVTSHPSSHLTESESKDEAEASALLHPTSGAQSAKKKCCSAGEKVCWAVKRARLASSGYLPHMYSTNPSIVKHHMEEQRTSPTSQGWATQ